MRKRGGYGHGDASVTLESRLKLKRSIESGETHVYDEGEKKCKTLDDLRSNGINVINTHTHIAEGQYGDVKRITDKPKGDTMAVVKFTGCLNHLLGDYKVSPFRSEHVEPRILNFLWKHLVEEQRASPHIVAPLGKHAIIPTITNTRRYSADGESMDSSLMYFMEMATNNNMRTHLARIKADGNKFELHFRVLLFQVCYTMECIFQRFPDFRHNDLKDDNVYLHTGPVGGYDQYTINGRTYYLPRIGATALVGDFDFATIPGYMFDNYKTVEQEWYTPSYCINTRRDQGVDMHNLCMYLRQNFASSFRISLRETFTRLYGRQCKKNYNGLHPMPGSDRNHSAATLLNDEELFVQFLQKPDDMDEIADVFVGDVEKPVVFPTTWDPRPYSPSFSRGTNNSAPVYHRHCPLIRPRQVLSSDDVVRHFEQLPSVVYYRDACVPFDADIDNEPSEVFDAETCKQIWYAMDHVYEVECTAESEFIGFDLDPDYKDEFMEGVYELATDFIRSNHVPDRWWCAAFSCAFADTMYDMNLIPADQKCWDMAMWCDMWDAKGLTWYTNMEMLHFCMQWTWHRNMDL